jgi:hypothetical protein
VGFTPRGRPLFEHVLAVWDRRHARWTSAIVVYEDRVVSHEGRRSLRPFVAAVACPFTVVLDGAIILSSPVWIGPVVIFAFATWDGRK